MNDQSLPSRSGGGIVFGGSPEAIGGDAASLAGAMRVVRRRWASGVAVLTRMDGARHMRGITISAFMPLSNDPPVMAVSVTADGDFASTLPEAGLVGLSILESGHEFVAERFAGRAPLPDRSFSGIAHRIEAGAPIIIGALAWCVGSISGNELVGDHRLVRVTVRAAGSGEDTDDPLVTYEGRYRRLEAG